MANLPLLSKLGSFLLMIYYLILSLPGFKILDNIFYGVKQSKYKDVPDKNLFPCDKFYHEYVLIHKCVRIHYASVGIPKKGKPMMLFIHGFPEVEKLYLVNVTFHITNVLHSVGTLGDTN
jgi:hypothetical protein